MGLDVVEGPVAKPGSIALGRGGVPELVVGQRMPKAEAVIYWEGCFSKPALQDVWSQTGLELVSAKCIRWNSQTPLLRKVERFEQVIRFVEGNNWQDTGVVTIAMNIGGGKNQPVADLRLWGNPTTTAAMLQEVGVGVSEQGWRLPGVRVFVAELFSRTCVGGILSREDKELLIPKITAAQLGQLGL